MQKSKWIVVALLFTLIASSGCVTKKLFRQNVEDTDTKISAVESGVEANERRISDLGADTDAKIAALGDRTEQAVELGSEAMTRADAAKAAAERAARGKLLWEVTLSDESVRFSFDEAMIPDEAGSELNTLIDRVRSLDKAVYIEVEGHTDNIGTDEYNQMLGEKRANAIRTYLSQNGIPLHAINTISYGESKPVADNGTPEGRAQNRRVVIRVLE